MVSGKAAVQVARTGRNTDQPHRRGPVPWVVVLMGLASARNGDLSVDAGNGTRPHR
jgi:hypothetical protein